MLLLVGGSVGHVATTRKRGSGTDEFGVVVEGEKDSEGASDEGARGGPADGSR